MKTCVRVVGIPVIEITLSIFFRVCESCLILGFYEFHWTICFQFLSYSLIFFYRSPFSKLFNLLKRPRITCIWVNIPRSTYTALSVAVMRNSINRNRWKTIQRFTYLLSADTYLEKNCPICIKFGRKSYYTTLSRQFQKQRLISHEDLLQRFFQ